MAFPQFITILAIALTFSRIGLTLSSEVKGSVSCSDCDPNYDFSGIRLLVKCDQVKKLSEAITNEKGNFKVVLPSDAPTSRISTSPKCLAKLLGGQTQLYAPKQKMVSKIVKTQGDKNIYTLLTPLVFSRSCHGKCGTQDASIGASKIFDFPVPSEFGLPPTSDFYAFLPIIGVP